MAQGGDVFLFTSESVTEGHPDKMCDQVADGPLKDQHLWLRATDGAYPKHVGLTRFAQVRTQLLDLPEEERLDDWLLLTAGAGDVSWAQCDKLSNSRSDNSENEPLSTNNSCRPVFMAQRH